MSENFAARGGGGILTAGVVQVVQSTVSYNPRRGTRPARPARAAGSTWRQGGRAVLVNATVSSATSPSQARPTSPGEAAASTRQASSRSSTRRSQATTRRGGGLCRARPGAGPGDGDGQHAAGREQRAGVRRRGRAVEERHNLADDGCCELNGEGDLPDALAGLQSLLRLRRVDRHARTRLRERSARCRRDPAGGDQRNLRRPAARACDIGAVERRPLPVVTTQPTATTAYATRTTARCGRRSWTPSATR